MHTQHLYLLLYPNQSLISSQLEPAKFAQHYAQGSTSFLGNNFLFVEIDPDFRHEYFKIDAAYSLLKPHEDGRPKATKFICNYRTLEHLDFDYMRSLYYCNALGNYVELKPGVLCSDSLKTSVADLQNNTDEMNIYLDINPTKMVVMSRHNFIDYGFFSIDPESFVSSPVILYTQVNFDINEFLTQYELNPFFPLRIPNVHPARMREAILEVRSSPTKRNKGISLDCPFDKVSYRNLQLGFMFVSSKKTRFYPLVSLENVEKDFYKFWKSM